MFKNLLIGTRLELGFAFALSASCPSLSTRFESVMHASTGQTSAHFGVS